MRAPHPDTPTLSRRQFLATVAASAASAASAAAATPTPPSRIRVGFLGTSYSHFAEKFRLIRQSPSFELVGLCDDHPNAPAHSPAETPRLTRQELLQAAELVIVESDPQHHARDARDALRAGRHVHLEKPPADSLPAFRKLLDLAQRGRCQLQIGYMWRYNPGIRAALEAAQQGWLGEIFLVRATMNTTLAAPGRADWARFRGGAMFEQGSHLIDMVVRLMGRPIRVTPFLKSSARADDRLADNTLAVLEYPRAWAVITSAPLQPNAGPHRFFEILGTAGSARVQPLEPPALQLDLKAAAGPYRAGRQEVPLAAYQRYVDEFTDLAAAIRGQSPLPVSPATELVIQETLMRACDMH